MDRVSLQSITLVKGAGRFDGVAPPSLIFCAALASQSQASTIFLGVNIDHVALLRQAGRESFPDPLYVALLAEEASADFITLHLRQDRRHIQDRDVEVIRYGLLRAGLNLQVAPTQAMLEVVTTVKPAQCCLLAEPPLSKNATAVLNVLAQRDLLKAACQQLRESGIAATLVVDAQAEQLDAAADVGASGVQLDTSAYARARGVAPRSRALQQLAAAAQHASDLGLTVTAGGGISYQNVLLLAGIRRIEALHVGHAIVARAVLEGMLAAVAEMRRLMTSARED